MSRTESSSKSQAASTTKSSFELTMSLVLAVLIGVAVGVGGYTFRYAEGLSYFKKDPKACVNCHIMNSQYNSWQASSHHQVAVCIDCHLPQDFVSKYLVKAENGWRHGEKFTRQDFVEPIVAQAAARKILQQNCIRCHDGLVHEMRGGSDARRDDVPCTHCHWGVGHGERAGLGGPLTELERKGR